MVTGASKGSIAASVVAELLDGGATVIATTSKLDDDRLAFYRDALPRQRPLRRGAVGGARQHGVLLRHRRAGRVGRQRADRKPWAASRSTSRTRRRRRCCSRSPRRGWPATCPRPGSRSEMEMKVLLWAVQRLIGGLSHIGAERDIASRLHVVLPGSPNRGMFGGDGAYGESKSALDAVVTRWKRRVVVGAAGHAGARADRLDQGHRADGPQRRDRRRGRGGRRDAPTRPSEMAAMLLDLCTVESKVAAAQRAAEGRPDRRARRHRARHGRAGRQGPRGDGSPKQPTESDERATAPSPRCRRRRAASRSAPPPAWDDLDVDPADLVVIVGGAELGPYGSSRTRFEMEVDNELSAAGVLELAWTTGLIKWEDDPKPGWYDTESGDLVRRGASWSSATTTRSWSGAASASSSTTARSTPITRRRCWCRCSSTRTSPSWCRREADARAFVEFDPEHTVVAPVPDSGDWQVTRKAGTEIRVPRKTKLSRTVGGADPHRVRPDGVGHQRRTWPARSTGWRCGTSSRPSTRSCRRGLHPDRADALGAPQPGGQHAGHRHGRHDVDADDVPRQPARPEQAERHPAGGPAERRCRRTSSSPTSAATAR